MIKMWDVETGKESLILRGHMHYVRSLALSKDNKRLFLASGDFNEPGEIKVWDVEAGKETLILRGHMADVMSLVLSADGKRLFSGGGQNDKTIRVWELTVSDNGP
jgi:WD40 repeat protein